MRDLSLHILDLMENSIRAGATTIAVTIEASRRKNLLRLRIEDNGPGLPIPGDKAADPFYTTKEGKRVGLGLSLFRATAEQAAGKMTLEKSPLGGLAVEALMELSHVDRRPLGDLPATFFTVACTNPHIDFHCRLISDDDDLLIKLSDLAAMNPGEKPNPFTLAQKFSERIKATLSSTDLLM